MLVASGADPLAARVRRRLRDLGSPTPDRPSSPWDRLTPQEAQICRLIVEGDRPLRDVVHTAIGAAAPFVQVPSHLMPQPNGEMRGVNYDHTILGWRGVFWLFAGQAVSAVGDQVFPVSVVFATPIHLTPPCSSCR